MQVSIIIRQRSQSHGGNQRRGQRMQGAQYRKTAQRLLLEALGSTKTGQDEQHVSPAQQQEEQPQQYQQQQQQHADSMSQPNGT